LGGRRGRRRRSGDGCKPGDSDTEWLPRRCPACRQITIIGHGRRRSQALVRPGIRTSAQQLRVHRLSGCET
jgi:hypothetical protein